MTDQPPRGTPASPASDGWREWMTNSEASFQIDRLVVWAAGGCLIVATAVVLVTLLTDRPICGSGLLLILGMPILFAGQLWAIFLLNSRLPSPQGS